MKAGERYPATVADIRERLAEQRHRECYDVTLENRANAILDRLSQDEGLLETCARLKVPLTQILWDMAVATAKRHVVKGLTALRRQTWDTYKKVKQRPPSGTVTDDDKLLVKNFLKNYQMKKFTQTLSRRTDMLARYSNPPGKEREEPKPEARGRREDIARNWLLMKLTEHLSDVPVVDVERDAIRCRLLEQSGFLHAGRVKIPDEAHWNALDTIKKQLSRLKAKPPAKSKNQS